MLSEEIRPWPVPCAACVNKTHTITSFYITTDGGRVCMRSPSLIFAAAWFSSPAITAWAENRLVAAERKKRGGNEAGRALKERRKVVSSRIELESNL